MERLLADSRIQPGVSKRMENIVRLARPILLVSLVLFALCAVSAWLLLQRNKKVTAARQAALGRWSVADKLEESIHDLLELLRSNVEAVAPLHRRIESHLVDADRILPSGSAAGDLLYKTRSGYQEYRSAWQPASGGPSPRPTPPAAVADILNERVLQPARRLEQALQAAVHEATQQEQRLWTEWGIGTAAVGATAGIGGLLLGFVTAASVRRSIVQLQVRLQDAAGRLGHDLPELEWQYRGSLEQIDQQFSVLDRHIEDVVHRLQQRDREVLRADQLAKLGRIAAGMAHEIRNPLTAIKLLVQSSAETNAPPTEEDMALIEGEIRRMETSLATLLDYARSTAPAKTTVAPAELVSAVLDLISAQAARQGVAVHQSAPAEMESVYADPDQLKQVLLNLALNALDAMPRGGQLTFSVDRAERQVRIRVIDSGGGISPEIEPHLFEPFASTKETGVGLGLAISRRIVEDHCGKLVAENRPSGGACFTIWLPFNPGQPSRIDQPPPASSKFNSPDPEHGSVSSTAH